MAGNLTLTYGTGLAGSSGNSGINFSLTSLQTGSVSIDSGASTTAVRVNGITIANSAGAFTLGNSANTFNLTLGGAGGQTHTWVNNSANTATVNSDVAFTTGGAGVHTFIFDGTGNWTVNHYLRPANSGSSSTINLTKNGSGTMAWTAAGSVGPGLFGGTVTIGGGTLSLRSGGGALLTSQNIADSGTLDYNVASVAQTLSGNITGSGALTVSAGTLTLTPASANTYAGNTTGSAGTLQLGAVNAVPGGSGKGDVTVNGTLDLNTFSCSINGLSGAGIIDTAAGGTPTLTVGANDNGGTFSGIIKNTAGTLAVTKSGTGTLILSGANTYSGATAVNAGTLLVKNSIGSGAVTVASTATLGGTGTIGGNVTWQSGSLALFTNGSPLAVSGNVTLNGNSVTVIVPGGTPLAVGTYILMTYNNTGSSGAFNAGPPAYGGAGVAAGTASSISTSGGTVTLTVVASGVTGTWTNSGNGNWSTAVNWNSNPSVPHAAGDLATFGTGTSLTTVTLDVAETVGAMTFNNNNSFVIANGGSPLSLDNSGSGAQVNVTGGTANSIAPAISLNDSAAVNVSSGKSLSVSGVISGTSTTKTLTVSGPGLLALSGNNTFGPSAGTVGTTLSGGGTLQLGHNNALGAGDLSVSVSSTVQAGSALTVANNMGVSSGATATVDNNGNAVTLSGVISGAGAVTKISSGTLTLSGVNTYNGDTTISAGALKFGVANTIPSGSGKGNVVVNGTLDLNGFAGAINGLSGSGTVDNTSGTAVTLAAGNNNVSSTFSGTIQNTGAGALSLQKTSTGTLTLSGNNTFSGFAQASGGGILSVSSIANALGSVSSIILGGGGANGTLLYTGTGETSSRVLSFTGTTTGSGQVVDQSGTGLLKFTANLNSSGSAAHTLTLQGSTNGAGEIAGVIPVGTAAIALAKSGTGTWTLSGNNAYAGGTTLNAGQLNINSATALGAGAGAFTIAGGAIDNTSGGALTLANNNPQSWNGDFTFVGTSDLNLGSGAVAMNASRQVTVSSHNLTVGGIISGVGFTLTKAGTGTLTLGGANTFSGGVTVNGGTVAIGNDAAFGSGTLNLSASSVTLQSTDSTARTIANSMSVNVFDGPYIFGGSAGLTFSGTILTGNGQKRFTINNATTTFSGPFNDGGAPTSPNIKDGAGLLILSGTSTGTKALNINAGTLRVNGSIGSGPVTVATNATLGGTGTINGAVTVNSGGSLAPGAGTIGTLTLGASPTLNGTLAMEINKTAATADKLALGNNALTLGGALTVSQTDVGVLAAGDSYTLLETTGTRGGWFSSVTLPALASGLSWDTNKLAANGVLDVYNFTTSAMAFSTLKNTPAVISAFKMGAQAASDRGTPVAVSASSASHGTVSVSSGALTYTPATNYTGSDSFTVTYGDGHGWQMMTVNATVNAQNVGPSITAVSAGGFGSFAASGMPSTLYTVQICTNLSDVPPFNDYATANSAANGAINFTDSVSIADHGNTVFYRLKQ